MKIIHVMLVGSFLDGLEYQENVLSRLHKRMGFDVSVLTFKPPYNGTFDLQFNDSEQYINADGISVVTLKYKNTPGILARYGIKHFIGLYDAIAQIAPDIFFIHGCQFNNISEIIRYKKSHPLVKIYVDNHADFDNTPVDTPWSKLFAYLITGHYARSIEKQAEKFWGVTPNRIQYLKKIYGLKSDKLDLLLMGGDDEMIDFENRQQIRQDIRQKHQIEETDFLVVTGGKIDKKKNIHLLIECFKALPYNVKLIIFGKADKDISAYFERLPENVKAIGWIPSSDAYNYFLASDLGVFPGRHSVLWEQAIATGLPCIYKHWKGMEHVDVGGNALLINEPLNNEKEYTLLLLKNIQRLSHKGEEYLSMKMASETKGVKAFSYREIAKRAIQLETTF